ncbi:low temperature requirement protein A [Microbacterium sp. NPDC057650]|uniref:low temperature requirement protein A n=1 Tax=unclassified Microbacterium TaxID=2609290 RepID=UPI00366EA3C8
MSDTTTTRFRLSRMLPRDPDQPHRAASSLELFFDLVFVVAVSIASADLHHELAAGHLANGVLTYVLVFFGIWWAWMNFTWFATSFDNDDWLYRVMTIVQMSGVLVLAAGIGPAYKSGDYVVLVLGYVIMRVAMISQWLRAARANPDYRRTALFYAVGIGIAQVLWLLFLLLPSAWQMPVFFVLAGAELAVPVIAESQNKTPWHPHHITERYSLFTLIVLGETILASANAVIGALDKVESTWSLISIAALTLISAASMWWIYFWPPHHRAITTLRGSIRYGYVHYFVLAAAAAFSVGIELQIDMLTKPGEVEPLVAAFAVAIPIAVFLLAIWWIAIRANADRLVNIVVPGGAVLVLVDALLPLPVALTTVILVAVVVVLVIRQPVRR